MLSLKDGLVDDGVFRVVMPGGLLEISSIFLDLS